MSRHRPPPSPPHPQAPAGRDFAALKTKLQQGWALHQRGELEQAERIYREVLARAPGDFDALQLLGMLEGERGNPAGALEWLRRAAGVNPRDALVHSNVGVALMELKRPAEALASFDRALMRQPDDVGTLINRGNALLELRHLDEALASYDRALALRPDYSAAHNNRGNVLQELRRFHEAVASYERCLAVDPRNVDALTNRGSALRRLKRHEEAIASCDRALAINADHVQALNNRGNILHDLGRYEEALGCFDRALALRPDYPEALGNRGNALVALGRHEEALACFDRALALRPGDPDTLSNRADVLLKLKRPDEAARSIARLLEAAPDYGFAKGGLLHAKMLACDWNGLMVLAESIEKDVWAGTKSADPFGYQAISRSPQALRRCAEIFAAERYPPSHTPLWNGEKYGNARIRIGYVSGEFRHQATSILMAELFELHDRNRFELFAFDNGWDDGSDIRARINRAFDEIVDISRLRDPGAGSAIVQRRIDILVNLNGYFGRARQGIFALRPCPIQVNYLGFPGTTGADYMDYLIADAQVIPRGDGACYSEKIVYLPDTYQVNDSRRRIAERAPARAEAGLPETGFVFCCFNNSYKITPEIFDTWMRLLKQVPGSVLWLLESYAAASDNLRREAEARGVAAGRLVFARMIGLDEHLARHRLADLFLDTLPYNAHTTASDALWAGLPLLTCQGTTFPGRVASSLLHAVGLPELVTRSLEQYETLALELATHPATLGEIRAKLARNRATHPLFDTKRFCRHIEAAYVAMWERARRGEPPVSFAVPT
jgi:predicted O-linked N-acetylglucosamine transferase (SPINDLY family)